MSKEEYKLAGGGEACYGSGNGRIISDLLA
jgi:hypothetical protein